MRVREVGAVSKEKNLSQWMETKPNPQGQDLRGTFLDNMKSPVHRWIRFPAGFSYDLVHESISKFGIGKSSLILDPFAGSGTTNVSAKSLGIKSTGIESHPLVAWAARVKTNWNFNYENLKEDSEKLLLETKNIIRNPPRTKEIPELLIKCYSNDKLNQLFAIRNYLLEMKDKDKRDLYLLGLLSILRKVSKAHTGWPYILPRKEKPNTPEVYATFQKQIRMMIEDLRLLTKNKVMTTIHEADSRNLTTLVEKNSVDFSFTSPPYLNNYDYADRTRLEFYFLTPFKFNKTELIVKTWGDMTKNVRSKLIISATHQARELGLKEGLMPHEEIESSVKTKLIDISRFLRNEKELHGGHKDYDLLVIGYFNDMYRILSEVYSVLKKDSYFFLVLGDSAPYGKHVPTDIFLSTIGKGIGFHESKIIPLRTRGGKWKTTNKHNVPLRESLVILKK